MYITKWTRLRGQRQRREAEERNLELKEFTQVAAHDLRAPLRRIKMFSSFLVDDVKNNSVEDVESDVSAILSSVDNMQNPLDSLVEFTQIGRTQSEHSPVSLREVLYKALENLEADISDKQASVSWEPDSMPIVYGHEATLIQMFQNLISNAIKFNNSEMPHVKIQVQNHRNEYQFSIIDNGIGIEESQYEKIFSPFCRLNVSKEFLGSGIGLVTCRRVIEQHHGELWVDSKPGEGSAFHLTLKAIDVEKLTPNLKMNRPDNSRSA